VIWQLFLISQVTAPPHLPGDRKEYLIQQAEIRMRKNNFLEDFDEPPN